MTHILITGGGGYIGSVLTEELMRSDERCSITVLDNFMHGVPSLAHLCHTGRLAIVRGDVRNDGLLREHLKNADYVIPLAAIVGAPACDADPIGALTTNFDAVRSAVRMMGSGQRMIIPITNSGYGVGGEGECTEESPLRPLTHYGRTKVKAEAVALERENAISLRLATVFGMSPRMRLDLLVNDFTWRAVTDRFVVLFEARFRRNYIHVRDVAGAFEHAMNRFDEMRGQPYNVGLSSANLTKRQLCQEIAKLVPGFTFMEAEVGSDPDKRDYLVSNARMEATGWGPLYDLADGIGEMVRGFKMFRRQHANA